MNSAAMCRGAAEEEQRTGTISSTKWFMSTPEHVNAGGAKWNDGESGLGMRLGFEVVERGTSDRASRRRRAS